MKNSWDDLVSKFQDWYPDCPPLRWHMREAFTDRWCRIDNLPSGDRRPETSAQRRIVLERNASVSTDVLKPRTRCAAILTVPRDPSEWSRCPWMEKLDATIAEGWIETWSDHPTYGEEAERVKLAVALCDWRTDRFHDLILDVATESNWTDVIFVALESGRAYSPFDGGADLFVESKAAAHALWDKYLAAGWTPPELYTGEPTTIEFPSGFPYGWRTLPWA